MKDERVRQIAAAVVDGSARGDDAKDLARWAIEALDRIALLEWLASDDTGCSSEFMAHVLLGGPRAYNAFPLDDCDVERCVGLLEAIPKAREGLPRMASRGKVWRELVREWATLEALLRTGQRSECYQRICECRRRGGDRLGPFVVRRRDEAVQP